LRDGAFGLLQGVHGAAEFPRRELFGAGRAGGLNGTLRLVHFL
jgi:hypothetical protein